MKKLILPLVAMLFMACQKNESLVLGDISRGIIIDQYSCGYILNSNFDYDTSIVITNQQDLDSLQSKSSCTIPTVDFSSNIVLHFQFHEQAVSSDAVRFAVYNNKNGNKYEMICFIEEIEPLDFYLEGMYTAYSATVIVPKPPSNYSIEFKKNRISK